MPDSQWTEEELDAWARSRFGIELVGLDEVINERWGVDDNARPSSAEREARLRRIYDAGPAHFWERWEDELRQAEAGDRAADAGKTLAGGGRSAIERWERLSPEVKAEFRRIQDTEADSIVPELSPLVGTGEVPGFDDDRTAETPAPDASGTSRRWVLGAVGVVIVALLIALAIAFLSQDDDTDDGDTDVATQADDPTDDDTSRTGDAETDDPETGTETDDPETGTETEGDDDSDTTTTDFTTPDGELVSVDVPNTTSTGETTVVRVRVLDADGNPVVGLQVLATIGNNPAGTDARHGEAVTDEDGVAEIEVEGPPGEGPTEVRVSIRGEVELVGETEVSPAS